MAWYLNNHKDSPSGTARAYSVRAYTGRGVRAYTPLSLTRTAMFPYTGLAALGSLSLALGATLATGTSAPSGMWLIL